MPQPSQGNVHAHSCLFWSRITETFSVSVTLHAVFRTTYPEAFDSLLCKQILLNSVGIHAEVFRSFQLSLGMQEDKMDEHRWLGRLLGLTVTAGVSCIV